ncbi:MAG: hypothetical protein ACLPQY_28745 [Streptosporangiaceae bacterium]
MASRSSGPPSSPSPAVSEMARTAGAALILAGSAALYLKIGATDTLEALTYSGRVIGALIFLCALVITAAAAGVVALSVFRNKFTSQKVLNGWGAAVILGCVISTVLSFLLFVVQLAALYFSPGWPSGPG